MMDLQLIRDRFPITKSDQLYLNHAAMSPHCEIHSEAMERFTRMRSSERVEYFPDVLDDMNDSRRILADLLNAAPAQVGFIQNTVEGLDLVARSIDWQEGDEIVIFRYDFPSNVYPFLQLKTRGVNVRVIDNDNLFCSEVDYLRLMGPKTRAITVSAVQFLTGQVMDLQTLGNACHERGILFFVDAIQATGSIPVDVSSAHVDFLANGGHKWMMMPPGLGFMYMSERLLGMMPNSVTGWLNREVPFDLFNWENPVNPDITRFELGTMPFMLHSVAAAVLRWREKTGEAFIHQRVKELTTYLRKALQQIREISLIKAPGADFSSGIVSFRVDKPTAVYERLREMGVTIAERESLLRVSPHFYNTEAELDRFINHLVAAL